MASKQEEDRGFYYPIFCNWSSREDGEEGMDEKEEGSLNRSISMYVKENRRSEQGFPGFSRGSERQGSGGSR